MRCKSILVPAAEEVDPASSVSEDQLSHAFNTCTWGWAGVSASLTSL